jgi:hypothetical protein
VQWQVFRRASEVQRIASQRSQAAAPEKSLRAGVQILFLRHPSPEQKQQQ